MKFPHIMEEFHGTTKAVKVLMTSTYEPRA